jgi:hypothetical protein
MVAVHGTATDVLGATESDDVTIVTGSGSGDKVVQWLHKNRVNFNSLVDVVRQGPQTYGTSPAEVGLRFKVQRPCTLTGGRIFKAPAAAGTIPITVWNYDTHVQLATTNVTWVADDGGQRDYDMPPVELVPGVEYCVSYFANAYAATGWRFNAQTYFEWPFVVIAGEVQGDDGIWHTAGCHHDGTHAFPEQNRNSNWYWIDVRVEYESPVCTYKGGREYFEQWPNWKLTEFPIVVFAVDYGFVGEYVSTGVNLPLPWNTFDSRDEIIAANTQVIAGANDGISSRFVAADPELAEHVSAYVYWDEPDLQGTGDGTPQKMRDVFRSARSFDSSRPMYFGFGLAMLRGQSFSWFPNGAPSEVTTANWRESAQLTDLVTGDDYSINDGAGIWKYAVQMHRLRAINDWRTPVWAIIETCILPGGIKNPTVLEMKQAAMLSIINGARGIVWFDHQFAYSAPDGNFYPQDFQAYLNDPVKKAGLTSFHGFLQSIADALWAPESEMERTVESSNTSAGPVGGEMGVPIHVTIRETEDYNYILAQAARPGTTVGTFKIPALANGTITVLNESRTISIDSTGEFLDTFSGDYEYHVYRVPVSVAPIITTNSLGTIQRTVSYSKSLVSLGEAPITWSVFSGSLPAGLTLSSSGLLSGTPTTSGSYSVTIRATNSSGHFDKVFSGTVLVAPVAPTITTTTTNAMDTGHAYSQTLVATGDSPFTWSVASGALPAGLTLSSSGVLSGTPTAIGSGSVTVQATNLAGSDTQVLSWTVTAPVVVEYNVFGNSAPPTTLTAYDDGNGSLVTTNQFRTIGTLQPDWQHVGVRIYIPSGATGGILTDGGKVWMVRNNLGAGAIDGGTGDILPQDFNVGVVSGTQIVRGTFGTLIAGQWNDIYFDEGLELDVNWGDGFLVAIGWDSGLYYVHGNPSGPTATSHITLDESTNFRSFNTMAGVGGSAHYGLDVILRKP